MPSPMLPLARATALAAALLALAPTGPSADVLVLKDGKRVEGDVQEEGDVYTVVTKYGRLSVQKDQVTRVVKVEALLNEARSFRVGGSALLEEAQKPGVTAAERKAKLASAGETLKRALDLFKEARSFSPATETGLDNVIAAVEQEVERCGEAAGPDTLAPVAPPKTPGATPAAPVSTPPPAPQPPAKPSVRVPVPAAPALAEAEKQIRSLFKDDYAKRSPEDRVALARRLLKAGEETKDDDALRYVALREARDLAAAAGNLATAWAAIGLLGKGFDIDAAEQEASAFATAARAVDPEEQGEAAFASGMALADRLAEADEFDAAVKLMTPLEDLARRMKSAEHVKTAQGRAKELRAQQTEWNRVRLSVEKLKELPDDAEACLAAGRYYAAADKWAKALPLLAKGSAPALQAAAAKELSKPADAAALAEAGDLWAAAAEKESAVLKAALQDRARDFYEKALPGLSGLAKARVDKKIAGLIAAATPSGGGSALNLLALVNLSKDAVAGTWKADGRALTSDAGICSRVMLPYEVPDEYDYRVDFTRVGGASTVALILTKGGREFVVETGWPSGQTGFAYVDGLHIDTNPTGVKSPVTNGRRTSYVVQVRNTGLRLLVDGRPVISWKTDYKNVTPHSGWVLPNKQCLGFGSYLSPTTFHLAELVEVSGRGRRAR